MENLEVKSQLLIKVLFLTLLGIFLVACSNAADVAPTNTTVPATATVSPTETPPPPTEEPTPEITGDPESGRLIFESGGASEDYKPRYACMNCHTLDGSEDDGPSLLGISDRAGERVPELSAAEYIQQSIMDPRAFVVEDFSSMGTINSLLLNEEEVDDLIAFLLTQ
jgi:hypothetical protein